MDEPNWSGLTLKVPQGTHAAYLVRPSETGWALVRQGLCRDPEETVRAVIYMLTGPGPESDRFEYHPSGPRTKWVSSGCFVWLFPFKNSVGERVYVLYAIGADPLELLAEAEV